MKNTTHSYTAITLKRLIYLAALIADSAQQPYTRLIAEAEKVVEKYMPKRGSGKQKKSPPKRYWGLIFAAILLGAAAAVLLKIK